MAGPIEICFSRLLLITMTWRPFRARWPGGRFPGLKPWAKSCSPSGAINYPKSCLSSRHSPWVSHKVACLALKVGETWNAIINPVERAFIRSLNAINSAGHDLLSAADENRLKMRFSMHPHAPLNRIDWCMTKSCYSSVTTIRNC